MSQAASGYDATQLMVRGSGRFRGNNPYWGHHGQGFVRDAYLEVFSDLAPHTELVEALELACHVGKAARALTWDRSLSALGYAEAGQHAGAPLECLRALLDDSYLGGA